MYDRVPASWATQLKEPFQSKIWASFIFINIIPDGNIGFHKQSEMVYKWVCRIGVEALHGRNGVMPGRPQGAQTWS